MGIANNVRILGIAGRRKNAGSKRTAELIARMTSHTFEFSQRFEITIWVYTYTVDMYEYKVWPAKRTTIRAFRGERDLSI